MSSPPRKGWSPGNHPGLTAPHGGICGRPLRTRPGVTCTNPWSRGIRCCLTHMEDEDRAELRAFEEACRRYLGAEEPVCWAWPVPEVIPEFADDNAALDFLWDWCESMCAICGAPWSRTPDHDHETGLARGILCVSCNIMEGKGGTPKFAKYRERNPAVMLGIRVVWQEPSWGAAWAAWPGTEARS